MFSIWASKVKGLSEICRGISDGGKGRRIGTSKDCLPMEVGRQPRLPVGLRDIVMTTSELIYPVIMFDKDGYTIVHVDEDWLTTMYSFTLKGRGGYIGCVVVDSDRRAFRIRNTKFVSGKGRFLGYTIFLTRMIRVEHTLDDKPLDMTLDDVKGRVLTDMKRSLNSTGDPDHWLGEMRKVKGAQSMREVIDLVLPYRDSRQFLKALREL